jgi:hypothetical protein
MASARVKIQDHMGESAVLETIPFKLERSAVMRRMLFNGEKPGFAGDARELAKKVKASAHPRAIYKVSRVSGRRRDSLEIDGVRFSGYLLPANLAGTGRVFVYAVTCGDELEALQLPADDSASRQYCLEMLKGMVLTSSVEYLREYLTRHYHLDFLFSLSPGEYEAWPLVYRAGLFAVLGDVKKLIGVSPEEDGSAGPMHSTSGLFYYTETRFENCQLCSREPCMMRRAPFSPELVRRLKLTPHTLCSR